MSRKNQKQLTRFAPKKAQTTLEEKDDEDEQPEECRYCGRMYAHRSNCPNNEESGY